MQYYSSRAGIYIIQSKGDRIGEIYSGVVKQGFCSIKTRWYNKEISKLEITLKNTKVFMKVSLKKNVNE